MKLLFLYSINGRSAVVAKVFKRFWIFRQRLKRVLTFNVETRLKRVDEVLSVNGP